MADFEKYFPIEINLEGASYEDVLGDSGGCTKFGLTILDLQEYHLDTDADGDIDCTDVKNLTRSQAHDVLKKLYWDYFKADQIPDQQLASYIVDSGLNQGRVLIVKYIQHIIGVDTDGHYGPNTFATLVAHITRDSGKDEFDALYADRKERYDAIVAKRPDQGKFYKGWMNRLNAIKY